MKAIQQSVPALSAARQARLQRFTTLKPLVSRSGGGKSRGAAAHASLAKAAGALKAYPTACRVRLDLRGPKSVRTWTVGFDGKAAAVTSDDGDGADLHLAMDEGVWLQIARGELAPMAAFVTGRLQIAGDCSLAKSLYRHLARPGTKAADIDLL